MGACTKDIDKTEVIKLLRKKGCRVTKQREVLIDIILNENCTCCKEIYYLAAKRLPDIGIATIYRMVSALEEIGAINKGASYRINHNVNNESFDSCMVTLESGAIIRLGREKLRRVLECGLKQYKCMDGEKIKGISFEK